MPITLDGEPSFNWMGVYFPDGSAEVLDSIYDTFELAQAGHKELLEKYREPETI